MDWDFDGDGRVSGWERREGRKQSSGARKQAKRQGRYDAKQRKRDNRAAAKQQKRDRRYAAKYDRQGQRQGNLGDRQAERQANDKTIGDHLDAIHAVANPLGGLLRDPAGRADLRAAQESAQAAGDRFFGLDGGGDGVIDQLDDLTIDVKPQVDLQTAGLVALGAVALLGGGWLLLS